MCFRVGYSVTFSWLCALLSRAGFLVAWGWLIVASVATCFLIHLCPGLCASAIQDSWHSLWVDCFGYMNQWLWAHLGTEVQQGERGVAFLWASWQVGRIIVTCMKIQVPEREGWLLGWQPTMSSVLRLGLAGHTHNRGTGRELTLRVSTMCWEFYQHDCISALLQHNGMLLLHFHLHLKRMRLREMKNLMKAGFYSSL